MTRLEFIEAIFRLCGRRDDDTDFIKLYDRALTVSYPVDWQKFFDYVAFNLDKKYLPLPKVFREQITQFRKEEQLRNTANIGATLRVYFSNGRIEDYTISGYANISPKDIIEQHRKGHNVVKALLYPANVTLIGNQIYPEDATADIVYSNS